MKKYLILLILLSFPFSAFSADITDWLSVSGTATTVYQVLNNAQGDVHNKDRASGVIDLNVSLKPTKNDEFFLRASFAKGSGFHSEGANYPFHLSPNADDLFVDLHNINGHSRDHLQEFWYAHRFSIQKDISLKLTAGIIDSSAFIDDNAYAADELGQFMNEVLVHNPLANLPSYDGGAVAEFEAGNFHIRVVGMQSKNENEEMDVRNYNWIGAQIGYKWENALGEGNYRCYGYTTNKRFENWDTDSYKTLKGVGLSFDQQLIKETLGAFLRAGWQDDSAIIDYNKMVSFGLNLNGSVWGRKNDELGVGYAYLKSPSKAEAEEAKEKPCI